MPRRKNNSSLQRPGVLLALLLLAIAGLLVGTRSHQPSGIPPHVLIEANRWIEEEPTSPLGWVSRASIHFYRKQYDEGSRDVRQAIRLNPGDLGQNYTPTTDVELTAEALKHGEEQLRNMLRDRPEMAEHVIPGDAIWNWAVRKFAGEDAGGLVYWDASDPSPFDGDSTGPDQGRPARIRVRKNTASLLPEGTTAFELLWAIAVFELHNVLVHKEWTGFEQGVVDGKLSRDEYVIAMIASEECAVERSRAFYLTTFLPWVRSKGIAVTSPGEWHCFSFYANAEARTLHWKSIPHWKFYSAWFDLLKIEGEFARGEYEHVAQRLDTLEAHRDQLTSDQHSSILYWRGHLHLAKGAPNLALGEFERATVLEQSLPWIDLVLGQAEALRQIGDLDQAIKVLSDWLEHPSNDFAYGVPDELSVNKAYAYQARGLLLFDLKKWNQALTDLNAAIELSAETTVNFCYRGWIRLYLNEFDLAEADFAHVLKLEPESANALAGRARLAIQRRSQRSDLSGAIADALRSCELTDWQHVDFIEILADAHRKNGNLDEAVRWEQKALEVAAEAASSSSSQNSEVPAARPEAEGSSSLRTHPHRLLATR